MKGRKPKSAAIKKREGNRGHRPIVPEPRVAPGGLRVPRYLSTEQRRIWTAVVEAAPVGVLTRADAGCVERFAVAWERYRKATKMIGQVGLMVQSPQGPIRNPLLVVQNMAAKEMHAAGSELGLSPVSRARLASPDAAGTDPMDLLLGDDGDDAWTTGRRVRH